MSPRINVVGKSIVYAGSAADLAAVADDYATGVRALPEGYQPELFGRAATLLRTGSYPAIDLGAVRFYRDRPGGKPFSGPFAPGPDEAWERQQRSLGVLLRG